MPPTDATKGAGNILTKTKTKEKERKQRSSLKSQTERLKTVVRRLPPNLPEDVFWQSVQQWVTDGTVVWKEYHQGKFRKRLNKENIPSRAYIAFKDEELLSTFSREYDGHLFRDKAGNESIAIVEFAPFQKVPAEKKKADTRIATIEKDEDYLSFIESLKEPASKPTDADSFELLIAANQPPAQPTTTPLLEALKAEKSAQKDKEAILRNHAHYKDIASNVASAASRKEESKKKAAAAHTQTPKPAEPGTGKRAAKKAAAKASQQQVSGQSNTTTSKNTTQASAASSLPAKPQPSAPAPKPRRERATKNPSSAAPPPANAPSVPPPANSSATGSSDPVSPPATSRSDVQPPAAASRRSRPVVGIASRQFEAALSGAVGRTSRRDREKEKDTGAAPVKSPKSSQAQIAATPLAPTILQRDAPAPKILSRPAQPSNDDPSGTPQEDTAGRGQRGRGRGRGGRGARGG